MDIATIELAARRIAEHAERHRPEVFDVVLHGGEPLLAGPATIEAAIVAIRAAVPRPTAVQFSVHTNATLLDRVFLEVFARHDVRIGVSLDGDVAANDRSRIYPHGGGSHERVAAALELMRSEERFHRQFAGLLCTIDVRNDPLAVLRALCAFDPPTIDLLLPHGNHTNPPPRYPGAPSYAAWLIAVFDAWYAMEDPPVIRLFQSIMLRCLGGFSDTEAIGGDLPGAVTIETDGSYEQSDALKTTVDGGARTGLTVHDRSIDEVLAHVAGAQPPALAAACQACPIVKICGGGLRAHRFRSDNGFDNPSAYCDDLFELITHIGARVRAEVERR